MRLKLNEFFLFLVQKKNFYGQMAAAIQRVAKPGLGTMAVGVLDGRITLYYDPAFVDAITMGVALFVLEHEILHLALDHLPRYLETLSHCADETDKVRAAHTANIAMDCAINSLLRTHKHFGEAEAFTKQLSLKMYEERKVERAAARAEERAARQTAGESTDDLDAEEKDDVLDEEDLKKAGMCLPEKYGLPDGKSYEWYQRELMKRVRVVNVAIGFGGAGSCHAMWDDEGSEGTGGSSDSLAGRANRLREQLKNTLRQALKHAQSTGRGLLPSGVQEFLNEYLADPIVPWWETFATRAKTSKTSKYKRSVTVPNRSLMALAEEDASIIPFPGRVRDKSWRVFFMRDTSLSMSTESLMIALSELQHMLQADEGMEIRFMDGDAAVHRDVVIKPGEQIPLDAVGRGGTDFDEYFLYMRKYAYDDSTKPDIVVVYTDGYAPAVRPENRLPSEIPIIWLVTPHYAKDTLEGYGEVIVCDPNHNDLYKR